MQVKAAPPTIATHFEPIAALECRCHRHFSDKMEKFNLRWVQCLLLFVALYQCGLANQDNKTNLTFMLIISYGQFGFNSSGGIPAAEMALEDINENPSILPGYNLVYDRIRDSQVCA